EAMPKVPRRSNLKSSKRKRQTLKFCLNCAQPVEDGIMDIVSFEKFLTERIKVQGKTNNLQNLVSVERTKNELTVTADIPFSKRYLKYLAKKYLKKNSLRDYLRVVASGRESFDLRYFNINSDEADEADGDE
ncbi:hypothetical protein BOX15_Mlig006022g2, partial [Macrostomum lignano]